MNGPDPAAVRRIVAIALAEDLGEVGDLTTDAVIDEEHRSVARIVARESTVIAGLPVAEEVFTQVDGDVRFDATVEDGESVSPATTVAQIRGRTRSLLRAERTALNFMMRMCGIAAAARAAVEEIAGTGATVLDTRKTAPGLRLVDKYAVVCGGAANHRMGLYDAAMIKDTHLGAGGSDIPEAVARLRRSGLRPERITVEVRSTEQLRQAIEAGAGRVLLDNMSIDELRAAVRFAAGRVVLEASGGLRPGALRRVAETGVDCISLGWLTHSAPAADLAMESEAGT